MRLLIIILFIGSIQALAQKATVEKLMMQAETQWHIRQFNESLNTLNLLLEKFPAEPLAYAMRAQVKEKLNNPLGALTDFNIAVALLPTSPDILLSRAILAFNLKRFDLAQPDFKKLLTFHGTETNMIYFRQTNNEGVNNIMTLQSNMHDQVYNYLGLIAFEQQNIPLSILYFDSAININKRQPDYYAHRGLARLKQSELQYAEQDFYQALNIDSEHAMSKHNMAALKRKEGNNTEAEKLLYQAKQTNSYVPQHYSGLALLQLESSRFTEAIQNFDTAIILEPANAELFLNRGMAKEKINNLKGALLDYSEALQLDERWPKAWFMQGNIFLKQNQLIEALENYSMAITLNPNYSLAYHNRAVTYMKLGNKKNACADMKTAEGGMPVDSRALAKMCAN